MSGNSIEFFASGGVPARTLPKPIRVSSLRLSAFCMDFWASGVFMLGRCFGWFFDAATFFSCCLAVPAVPDGFSGFTICVFTSLIALFFSSGFILVDCFDDLTFFSCCLAVAAPVVPVDPASVVDLTACCFSCVV